MKHHIDLAAAKTITSDSARPPRPGIRSKNLRTLIARSSGEGTGVFVQLSNGTYTGKALRARHDLVGRWITVQVDQEDLRTIVAMLPNGVRLGVLTLRERASQRPAHSRDLRQTILRLDKP